MWVLTAFSGRLFVTDRGGYGAGGLKREELFDDAPFPLLPLYDGIRILYRHTRHAPIIASWSFISLQSVMGGVSLKKRHDSFLELRASEHSYDAFFKLTPPMTLWRGM